MQHGQVCCEPGMLVTTAEGQCERWLALGQRVLADFQHNQIVHHRIHGCACGASKGLLHKDPAAHEQSFPQDTACHVDAWYV
jgi:hypothetical protein